MITLRPIYTSFYQTAFHARMGLPHRISFFHSQPQRYSSLTKMIPIPYAQSSLSTIKAKKIINKEHKGKTDMTSQWIKNAFFFGCTCALASSMLTTSPIEAAMENPEVSNTRFCSIQSEPLPTSIVDCINMQKDILGFSHLFQLEGNRIICSQVFVDFLNFATKQDLLILTKQEKEKISQSTSLSLQELNSILQRPTAGFKRKKKTERWDIPYNPKHIIHKKQLLSFFHALGFMDSLSTKEVITTIPLECTKAIIFGSTFPSQFNRALKILSLQKAEQINAKAFYFLGSTRLVKDTKNLKEYTILCQAVLNIEEEKTRDYWKIFFQEKEKATESNTLRLIATLILGDKLFEEWKKTKELIFVNASSEIEGYRATTGSTLKEIAGDFTSEDQIFTYLNYRMYQRLAHQLLIQALLPKNKETTLEQFRKNCQGIKLYFCSGSSTIKEDMQEEDCAKEIAKIFDEIAKNVYNMYTWEQLFHSIALGT